MTVKFAKAAASGEGRSIAFAGNEAGQQLRSIPLVGSFGSECCASWGW